MRIAVYGATGRAGSQIVAEALRRGHEVLALSRTAGQLPDGVPWQQADLADTAAVATVAASSDAVVSAIGPSLEAGAPSFAGIIAALAAAVGSTPLLVVGGAGSLLDADGTRLIDSPDFPAAWRSGAMAQVDALTALRDVDADWRYLSPAPELDDGERTGAYRVGADHPVGSYISFADFAVAVLDELERPAHRRERFTVATR